MSLYRWKWAFGWGLSKDGIIMHAGWMVTPLLAYEAVQRKLCIQKTAFWEY